MDIRKVKKLIELLEESGLSEIEITEGEDKVRISKQTTVAKSSNDSALMSANDINGDHQQADTYPSLPNNGFHEVKAPMIGTFLSSI